MNFDDTFRPLATSNGNDAGQPQEEAVRDAVRSISAAPLDPRNNPSCPICHQSFKRNEHLERHVRMHTMERPFVCVVCEVRFARKDSLQRHLPIHADHEARLGIYKPPTRTSRACDACARSRLKCDGERPCARCRNKSINCDYYRSRSGARGTRARRASSQAPTSQAPSAVNDDPANPAAASNGQPLTAGEQVPGFDFPTPASGLSLQSIVAIDSPQCDVDMEIPNQTFDDFWYWLGDFGSGTDTGAHASFEPQPRASDPPDGNPGGLDGTEAAACPSGGNSGESPDAPSPWPLSWTPRQMDAGLPATEEAAGTTIPGCVLEVEDFAHVGRLSREKYEEVAANLRDHASQPVYRSFGSPVLPAAEVMNSFIQLYFEHFHDTMPFIHKPSFDPSREHWLLVLAVAAAGCRFSQVPRSDLYALKLTELVRRSIMVVLEMNNSVVRKLWLLQASILSIVCMQYSGNSRFWELAQTLKGQPVARCRWYGLFKPAGEAAPALPGLQGVDDPESLEGIWCAWRAEETLRRLGFCSWWYDMTTSLHLGISPGVSVGELQHPLPCLDTIWDASSPQQWKDRMMRFQGAERPPGFQAALHNLLERRPVPESTGEFSRLVLARAAHALAESQLAHPTTDYGRGVPISAEHLPGALALDESGGGGFASAVDMPRAVLVDSHMALLAACWPLPAVRALAGWHAGPAEADRAGAELSRWVDEDPPRARRAVLCAALIYCRTVERQSQAFYESATFLMAVLTLWAYGRIFSPGLPGTTTSSVTAGGSSISMASLDYPTARLGTALDSEQARRWVEEGHRMRGYLRRVGNIWADNGPRLILRQAVQTLNSMAPWGISQRYAQALERLDCSKIVREATPT